VVSASQWVLSLRMLGVLPSSLPQNALRPASSVAACCYAGAFNDASQQDCTACAWSLDKRRVAILLSILSHDTEDPGRGAVKLLSH